MLGLNQSINNVLMIEIFGLEIEFGSEVKNSCSRYKSEDGKWSELIARQSM